MPDSRLIRKEDSLLSALVFVKTSADCLIRSLSVMIRGYDDCGDFDRQLQKRGQFIVRTYVRKMLDSLELRRPCQEF